MHPDLLTLPTQATDQRDAALERVEAHADDADRAAIDQVLEACIAAGRPFSANDARPYLDGVRPALIGARFMAAARRGLIVRTDWVTSTDPSTHARPIALWQPAVTR